MAPPNLKRGTGGTSSLPGHPNIPIQDLGTAAPRRIRSIRPNPKRGITPPAVTQGPVPSYDGARGRTVTRDASLNVSDTAEGKVCPIPYGTVRFTPQVVHTEIANMALHVVFLVGEGEIDSFTQVLLGGEEIYPATQPWCAVETRTGTLAQTELTSVPDAQWASSYPGRAMLKLTLELASAKFSGGIPDIEVIVKGRKVYDPRTATTAWSENPFLIAWDLLTDDEFGPDVDAAKLDTASWEACMDRCDETVDGAARWRADFVVTDRAPSIDTVRDMLKVTCGGFVYWADGKWYARLDEQNVVGCRPTGTAAVGATDRAQSFVAPGPRVKAVCKLDLAAGFSDPTVYLCSALPTPLLSVNQWGIETDATPFTAYHSAVLSKDAGEHWEGAASLKVACDGSQSGQGGYTDAAASAQGTYTGRLRIKGTAGKVLNCFISLVYSDASTVNGTGTTFNLDGTWQFLQLAALATNTAKTLTTVRLQFRGSGAQGVFTYYIDGLELELVTALVSSTVTGLAAGTDQQITFDLSSYRLTKGATYYLVLATTTGVTWHQIGSSAYAGGQAYNYTAGAWAAEAAKEFWFQVHYADWEINDHLNCDSSQIPILGSQGKSSLSFSRAREEAPNAVEVSFYDTTDWVVKPFRTESATVQAGTEQLRLLQLQSLAVPALSCAGRLALQWYKLAQHTNRVGCDVPQHGITIAPGDVVALTSVIGPLAAKWYRVRSISRRLGTFTLELIEYAWTDYSTEDAITGDSFTIPTAASSTRTLALKDDFTSGDVVNLYIGELGWTLTGALSALTYLSEADHPGIARVSSAGAGHIALSSGGQQFIDNAVWDSKFIIRPTLITNVNGIINFGDMIFEVRMKNDHGGGNYSVIVEGTDTTLDIATTDWMTYHAWCSGAGTAYYEIKWGANVLTGNKAVAGTAADHFLYLNALDTSSTIDIDYAHICIGMAER